MEGEETTYAERLQLDGMQTFIIGMHYEMQVERIINSLLLYVCSVMRFKQVRVYKRL